MEKKKKANNRKKLSIAGIIIGLMMVSAAVIGIVFQPEETGIDPMQEQLDSLKTEVDSLRLRYDQLHELSWENIDYWLEEFEIDHPEIVKQQIALETGMLTSTICAENNNLFGMKEPRVRETTALGTKRGHAYYENYVDSIKDYKLWQDNMYVGGDYYAFLNRVGYAEATYYITALKSI